MLVVLAVLAAAPSPQLSWNVTSFNGGATIAQTASADDKCAVRCSVAGKELWSKPHCLGRASDFIFVSEDCGTALVLSEYPVRIEPTGMTPVALSVAGGAVRTVRLEELMTATSVRGEGKRVRWLGGAVGEPGVKPHVNSEGTGVEFSTIDRVSHVVRFSNPEDLAPPRAVAQAPGSSDGQGLYQFVDEQGSTQFVMGLNQVPQRFRKKATPVQAEIDSVQGVKMPPRPPSYSTSRGMPPPRVSQPVVRQAPPPVSGSDCQIYGLSGPACTAVQDRQAQRYRRLPLEVRLPPAPPPKPPPSGYER